MRGFASAHMSWQAAGIEASPDSDKGTLPTVLKQLYAGISEATALMPHMDAFARDVIAGRVGARDSDTPGASSRPMFCSLPHKAPCCSLSLPLSPSDFAETGALVCRSPGLRGAADRSSASHHVVDLARQRAARMPEQRLYSAAAALPRVKDMGGAHLCERAPHYNVMAGWGTAQQAARAAALLASDAVHRQSGPSTRDALRVGSPDRAAARISAAQGPHLQHTRLPALIRGSCSPVARHAADSPGLRGVRQH